MFSFVFSLFLPAVERGFQDSAGMADSTLQKDKPVALYCRSGKRSKKAAAILSEKGYKVYELDKGFNAWQEAGEKVEK